MASKAVNITAKSRSELGSRANKRLRDTGMLPGVIYGHKEAVLPVTLTKKEVVGHLNHGAHLFDLALDGKSEKVLIKEVQYDHLGSDIIHVDFARVSLDEKVTLTVSLELKGEPKGEKDGGVLQQVISELEIECLVTDIPDVIIHNVSNMEKDSILHIKELKLPPGVTVLQDEDLIVATVREIAEETEGDAEAVAEPELIGRKAAEDGDEAAAEEAK